MLIINKNYFKFKVTDLKNKMANMKSQCAKAKEEALNKSIQNLPQAQQNACRAILAASKVKSDRGRRYETEWVYECLLLRIKSKKAYNHLRKRNILALPSIQTLNRYTRFIKSRYGFQENVFRGVKEKTKNMLSQDTHGMYFY